jgi:hypothetical protein
MHSYHCISFRYARCTTRGCEARADGTEPQDGEWWIHLEDGWMEPEVHDRKEDARQASII